ncbi:MAG TPA: methyltransferase, partial [Anaerolineales bacterium]
MNENIFRILAAIILFTGIGISSYFRRKADRESGETISRRVDGTPMMTVIRLGGLVLWLSPLVYLINPSWMAWSKIGLPEGARWLGLGLGVLCVLGIYWLFSSIGSGITPTSATRREHQLVMSGPYRWVRHPLYTVGSSMFVAFGLMADNWCIAALGVL